MFALLVVALLPCALGQTSTYSPPAVVGPDVTVSPKCLQGTPGTFSVTGNGESKAKADEAQVSLTISLTNATAQGARDTAAVRAQRVIDTLDNIGGLEPENVTTTSVSIYPKTTYDDDLGTSRVIGYTYTNDIQVSVGNVTEDLLAEILDKAVVAGGNNLTINGVTFDLSPGLSYEKTIEARKQAAADATTTAKQYADAFAVNLGPILSIVDESPNSTPVQNYDNSQTSEKTLIPAAAASTTDFSRTDQTPISIGEQRVAAQISVVYTICNP